MHELKRLAIFGVIIRFYATKIIFIMITIIKVNTCKLMYFTDIKIQLCYIMS